MTTVQTQQRLLSQREAGVCAHIASLPGKYGIGDIGGSAIQFIDTMGRMDLSVWQFLPLGPTAYGDSPYQSLSTFAGNEMLIDLEGLVKMGLLRENEVAALAGLPADYVDYGTLIPLKTEALRLAAQRFMQQASSKLKSAFHAFVNQNDDPWLHEYALFRILKNLHGERPWPEWDAPYVQHDDSALRQLELEEATRIQEIKIIQFLFAHQWSELRVYASRNGIRLFGDMPIYVALDSADAWSNPEILRMDRDGRPDAVAGVPPDYFSEDGQLWGNPLYDWAVHHDTGYRWWLDRLQFSSVLMDIVRIDHFRGFESYWAVPADAATARVGEWVPGPGDEIFSAMKQSFGTLPIVAEDLGVITPEVEALRDRYDIPGMVVLQFDVADPNFDLSQVPENRICYTGTHDNDTTLGWFRGSPGGRRSPEEIHATQRAVLALTGGSEATVSMDLIKAAMSTGAKLVIAPMQDYLSLGSEARLNTPGTSSNNWRWRLQASQISDALCEEIASAVAASGRSPQEGTHAAAG